MTSIAFYHTLPEEQPFAEQWAEQHHVDVTCFPFELTDETLHTVKRFDGISYKQRFRPSNDPDFYRRLHDEYGIRQIALRSAGIDSIDVKAAHEHGIRITNVPSYSPSAVAQLALTHILQLLRHVPQYRERNAHQDFAATGLMSRELGELTVGIIGVGRIGSTLARMLHALGVTVLGNDIRERDDLDGIVTYTSKDDLLARADVVSMHTYLDETTYHLMNAHRFAQMKPTAIFINASRGPIVDTQALIAALQHHEIAAAGLDVIEGEATLFGHTFTPGAPTGNQAYDTLVAMPNVVITPHVAFFTDIAVRNMAQQSLDDALTIIQGGTSDHEIRLD